jgi:Tfp pilus assembly protein PilF
MRRLHGWQVLLLLGLGAQMGCFSSRPSGFEALSFRIPDTGSSVLGATAGTAAAPASPELPPQKAADLCLATGRELEKNGFEAQAILQYEKARQYAPKSVAAIRRLAVLHDRQGDHAKALAEYQLALKANPRDADVLNDLGYFHYQRHDWAEARKWLQQAVEVNPKHQRAWVNLGLTLGQEARYQESFEAFARALTPAEAHCNLGVILAQHGKHAEAKQAFGEALKLEPNLKQAQIVLARLENPEPLAEPPPPAGKPTVRTQDLKGPAAARLFHEARERRNRPTEPAAQYSLRHDEATRSLPTTRPLVVALPPDTPAQPVADQRGGTPATVSFE